MADVRALLKAKRQEARITHPLASYSAAGQLRCAACGTAVKHASAWEGHVGSKAHRTNAARLRQEQARAAQREQEEREREERESLKRKAMDVDDDDVDGDVGGEDAESAPAVESKKRRIESEEPVALTANTKARNALPADFFSDPSMAPPPREDEDEDEGEDVGEGAQETSAAAPAAGPDALDDEWARFQQAVVNAPDYQETYERATVAAEPVLAAEVPAGFPAGEDGAQEEPTAEALDEEGLRRRREQDERELIMDRLLEEEQAQEEADARVSALKVKLEALRRRREAAKAAKKGGK